MTRIRGDITMVLPTPIEVAGISLAPIVTSTIPPVLPIKSIQYGTCNMVSGDTSRAATITAVTTANCLLLYLGTTNLGATDEGEYLVRLELTNPTTVTATIDTTLPNVLDAGEIKNVNFCVVEFQDGIVKSNNQGTIILGAAQTTNTATIPAVVWEKTLLSHLGHTARAATEDEWMTSLTLTNTTTITARRATAGASNTQVNYQAVEFV